MNPIERQHVWDRRLRKHAEHCTHCQADVSECAEWLDLINAYNSARMLELGWITQPNDFEVSESAELDKAWASLNEEAS